MQSENQKEEGSWLKIKQRNSKIGNYYSPLWHNELPSDICKQDLKVTL